MTKGRVSLSKEKLESDEGKKALQQADEDLALLFAYYAPELFGSPIMAYGLSMVRLYNEIAEVHKPAPTQDDPNPGDAGSRENVPGKADGGAVDTAGGV
jgi:hypothetical protein